MQKSPLRISCNLNAIPGQRIRERVVGAKFTPVNLHKDRRAMGGDPMIGDQIGRDNPGRWIAHLAEAMDIRHHGIPF
jgi:hypothetical protein